jgi:hypothetical protein
MMAVGSQQLASGNQAGFGCSQRVGCTSNAYHQHQALETVTARGVPVGVLACEQNAL